MIFGRRGEKRAPLLTFERILVPLAGTEADDAPLRLTALLLGGTGGQAALLHVIGRTVPYVMRNSTAPVWCLRAETEDLAHTP